MSELLNIKKTYCAIAIILLYIAISLINNHILLTEGVLSQWYEGMLNLSQVKESIAFAQKWEWAIILFNIAYIFLKISCVAVCLYLGLFFFTDDKHTYKTAFNIALKAEVVYVAYAVLRLCWFQFVHLPESLEELQVMPLSLMVFFDPTVIEPWLIYPLNTLNIFEIFYVLMLSALMATAIQTKFRKAFELVFVSYGAGLLLMMVAQMFLILNLQ